MQRLIEMKQPVLRMRKLWQLAFVLMVGLVSMNAQAQSPEAQISTQDGVVSLQFQGLTTWVYDLTRVNSGTQHYVELSVPKLNEATIKKIEKFKNSVVKSIVVDRKVVDDKSKIRIDLFKESIESLDYLTESPSRLIVDFYEKESASTSAAGSTLESEAMALKKVKLSKQAIIEKAEKVPQNKEVEVKSPPGRSPATADFLKMEAQGPLLGSLTNGTIRAGVFDGADANYQRFEVKDYEVKEESIIRSRANYFIAFPMLESETPLWSQIKGTPPLYQIRPQENEENKQARLLLKLFERQRFLVFQKTKLWFDEKYPKSEYSEVLDFVAADVEMELSKQEGNTKRFGVAIQLYKDAIRKHPKSPLAEKVSLGIGIAAYDHGDLLTALRLFQEHIENKELEFQGTTSREYAKLGQAQVYDRMTRAPEALEIADSLERGAKDPDLRAEAAYRRGDINFRNKNYGQAVKDYRKAQEKYPQSLPLFPSAIYNQAEALFWQEKYKESLATYVDFLKKFPTNDHSAFAMTRAGEIMGILGVDSGRVVAAFLETYFRFGENPKAIVARIRLLSARMQGMKTKEVEPATREILELSKKLDWPLIESFATVMVADGYTKRGEFDKSIDLLTQYYQKNPLAPDLNLYQTRLVNNINDLIRRDLDEGKFLEALKTHQKYADSWLKSSERLDTDYSLGRAYEMSGTYGEAEKFYKSTLNRAYALQGTAKGKELAILQNLPSDQVMNLRLASVKVEQGQWSEAYEFLKTIKRPGEMSDKDQVERVILTAQLLEKKGDLGSASRFLSELLKTWRGQPELVAKPYLNLAEVEFKLGQRAQAIQSLEKIRILEKDSGKVPPWVLAQGLHRLADTYIEDKADEKAIEVLNNYLERFEDQHPLASQRYRLGLIYFQKGEAQKAAEVWTNFKGDRASFWQNVAQEKLRDSKWKSSYRKYFDRIPAMAGVEEKTGATP